MPTEMRQIAFTQREVSRALIEYDRRRDHHFPSGSVRKVDIQDDPDIHATVTIESIGGGASDTKIGTAELAAALILYCINYRIPLPAESAKRLQKVGDGVALFVVKKHKTKEST